MPNPQRIHVTPSLLRYVGLLFLVAGLSVIALILAATFTGKWNGLFDFCFALGLGSVFACVGWAVFADDYLVIDTWSRNVVFYQRFFRSTKVGRTQLNDQSRLRVEPDPDNPPCHRLMLDDHLVKERLSVRQAERLKAKLETALGLA